MANELNVFAVNREKLAALTIPTMERSRWLRRPVARDAPFVQWATGLPEDEVWQIGELLFAEPEGVVQVGDSFRHESGFADDLATRIARHIHDAALARALSDAGGRAPAAYADDAVTNALARVTTWQLFTATEMAEVLPAARAALAVDPAWAEDGAGYGPEWQRLADALKATLGDHDLYVLAYWN